MIEWGLCCIFRREPIRFRRATAASLRPLPRPEQLRKLAALIRSNAENLKRAFERCAELQIGAFRINSELLMLATHADAGYRLEELPEADTLQKLFDEARNRADRLGLRRSLHPDQFVVLNSPDPRVRANSRAELEHQFLLAELCGATEINLHAGGVYGDKVAALDRLRREIDTLPEPLRQKLTLENDDRSYTPAELLPLCRELGIPFTYDVHHHRVNPDHLTIEEATRAAAETWRGRKIPPHVHLSSPQLPWSTPGDHRPHAGWIDPADFPECWRDMDLTVDVEAKEKENAIAALRSALGPNF